MVTRWKKYVDEGIFTLSVPLETTLGDGGSLADFWTTPWPYWDMETLAPDLWDTLRDSALVIFKVWLFASEIVTDTRRRQIFIG